MSPVVSVQGPPLMDMVLQQLVTAPNLLPAWVSKLQLVKMDMGTRAPRLKRVRLPSSNGNGTLPEGDMLLDFEVEMDLDARIELLASLQTGVSKLVSRLTGHAHAATVQLVITRIRQSMVLRVRFRPGAAAAFVGLLRFTSKPAAELTLLAADVSGAHIKLPLHHFPGNDTITAWVVQKLFRDLMALPHRFIPIDVAPLLDMLETRTLVSSVPLGGALRIQVMEAVGLTDGGGSPSASSAAHFARAASMEGALHFDVAGGDTDASDAAPSDGAGRQRGGLHAYAHIDFAFGAKSARSAASGEAASADGRLAWAPHEGVTVVDLVGPADSITITLRRRGVPGRAGRLGAAHFKLYWAPDGSSSVFYADADGTPVVVKAALASPKDAGRVAAGVRFSGREGFADVWVPLVGANGEHAAVRLQLTADWFGAKAVQSPAEAHAALVLQRFVRRWKARRAAARERALLAFGAFTPQLQLCVTLQRARGLPLKSGYWCQLTVAAGAAGAGAAAFAAATAAPLRTRTCEPSTCEPCFGQTLRVDAPAAGGIAALWVAKPTLRVLLFRKDVLLAAGELAIPATHPQQRGGVMPVWMRLGGEALEALARRSEHKLHKGLAPGAQPEHATTPAVLLYLSVVLKSAHEPARALEAGASGAPAPLPRVPAAPRPPVSAHAAAAPLPQAAAPVGADREADATAREERARAADAARQAHAAAEEQAAAAQADAAQQAADAAAAAQEAAEAAAEQRAADAAAAAEQERLAAAEAEAAAARELVAAEEAQMLEAEERERLAAEAVAAAQAAEDAAAAAAAERERQEADAASLEQAAAAERAAAELLAAAERERQEADAAAAEHAAAAALAAEEARQAAERERLEAEVAAKAQATADKLAAEEARKTAERERKEAEAAAKAQAAADKLAAEEARKTAERERKAAEAATKAKAAADRAAADEARKAAERERKAADAAAKAQAAADKAAAAVARKQAEQARKEAEAAAKAKPAAHAAGVASAAAEPADEPAPAESTDAPAESAEDAPEEPSAPPSPVAMPRLPELMPAESPFGAAVVSPPRPQTPPAAAVYEHSEEEAEEEDETAPPAPVAAALPWPAPPKIRVRVADE